MLTRQENIYLAKRMMIDSIWKSARIEGLNVTFPQTITIVEKLGSTNANVHDILVILNLKHAWELLISTVDEKTDLAYVEKLHAEVAKDEALAWGTLRTGRVGIAGTSYIPEIPRVSDVQQQLFVYEQEISEKASHAMDIILERMLWMMKSQLFWDGNKRTAMLVANKDFIRFGFGVLSVPIPFIAEFHRQLQEYYETGNLGILSFFKNNCIQTIQFDGEERCPNA